MPAYTIVTTTATQNVDELEVGTLSADFENESEVMGYSRRMAEEMVGFAHQMSVDFDYSNVALYEGDLFDTDLTTDNPAFRGLWVLDDDGPAFVTPEEFRADNDDAEA